MIPTFLGGAFLGSLEAEIGALLKLMQHKDNPTLTIQIPIHIPINLAGGSDVVGLWAWWATITSTG